MFPNVFDVHLRTATHEEAELQQVRWELEVADNKEAWRGVLVHHSVRAQ